MGLSQRLAVGAYGLVCVATVTALLSPVSLSVERSWAFPVLFVVAHVALGVAVRRRWALAGPAALSLAVFVAGGAAGLAWTVLLVGMPALMGLTALGWLVAARPVRAAASSLAGSWPSRSSPSAGGSWRSGAAGRTSRPPCRPGCRSG